MSKLTDHIYNSKHLSNVKPSLLTHTQAKPLVGPKVQSNTKKPDRICASIPRNPNPDVNRFPVTLVNVRFYNILCGLAHSQWKGEIAVQLVKTTVNFESLGESIEPAGHCDNFFIAGHCRNFFELEHPRNSRKHYFYSKVGYSLLLYNSPCHENVVRFSFLGANSALKLHLADKLCFPVCHDAHWFVFIVDLKNKYFILMDSIYDQFHAFQIFVRNKIIKTFKVAWFLHAEVKLDLSDFTILYPPVPKQTNADDCGIFALKFMELWDEHVDLRQRFGQSDIPNIRVILGNSLYFSEKNKKDKSLVNKMYREGINPRLIP